MIVDDALSADVGRDDGNHKFNDDVGNTCMVRRQKDRQQHAGKVRMPLIVCRKC